MDYEKTVLKTSKSIKAPHRTFGDTCIHQVRRYWWALLHLLFLCIPWENTSDMIISINIWWENIYWQSIFGTFWIQHDPLESILLPIRRSHAFHDVTHLVSGTHTHYEKYAQGGDCGHMERVCVWPRASLAHRRKHDLRWCTCTCMLMCTSSEPWPLALTWSGQGWRSVWMCVKEKVIALLMESIHLRALTLEVRGWGGWPTPRLAPASGHECRALTEATSPQE